MITIPKSFSEALDSLAGEQKIPARKQTQALKELFELFTTDRAQLGQQSYLDQPHLRMAYLRYHLPINIARAMYVLEQVSPHAESLAGLNTIVDLGGGPGSAAWASLLSRESSEPVQVQVFDYSSGAIRLGEALRDRTQNDFPDATISFGKQSLPGLPSWKGPALVWLAMVLNELLRNRRFDLVRFASSLTRRCDPGSILIITEPALRKPGRDLLQFHDVLLELGGWEVLAPCTHQQACPLLKLRDRSWCHFRFDWRVPRSVQQIAAPLNLECEQPSVAYLALRRLVSTAEPSTSSDSHRARVIGDPMTVQTGGKGVYVCTQGERELLSPVSGQVARGDIIPYRKKPARTDRSSAEDRKSQRKRRDSNSSGRGKSM